MKESLRTIFQSPFDIKQWNDLLQNLFKATELRLVPENFENNPTEEGYYLGNIQTSDSYRIGLFHYNIKQGSVANKRVGLRKLVKTFINPQWGEFDAALVIFNETPHPSPSPSPHPTPSPHPSPHPSPSPTPAPALWRLSFISDIKGEATSPKRYTYVFGNKELFYKTPIDRFIFLKDKGISFENLKKAFSVEALSDEFFDKYREQYADFIQYVTGKRFVKVGGKWEEKLLATPNAALMQAFGNDEKKIRDYIKKMMGRITFLHFLQRKGWMCGDLNYMQNMFENSAYKNDYLDSVLEPLFFGILNTKPAEREALFTEYAWDKSLLNEWKDIPYLNGGLFERDEEDEPESRFPADYFRRLFQFFSEYNFTIDENDPNDAEVGVDPEMLGKIFENLLEDNKDKGAFYTPKEIVRYMCQESLIAYLETNTSIAKDKIRQFVLSPEEGVADIPENKKPKLLTALEEVKICDPAIGSGAFPMGLLNELLKCREVLVETSLPWRLNTPTSNRSSLKKEIIQNNIYGVDIEKGAVDIARLRFWLSIVVDEETPSPLPNLDYKIMQGNSLIESFMGVDLSKLTYEKEYKKDKGEILLFDDEKNLLQKTVSHLLSSYYSCSDHDRKVKLQQDISDTINKQLEAQAYNPEILAKLKEINLAENNKFFLWHTWFSDVFNRDDKEGFDIVIGNPPYGAKLSQEHKKIFKEIYLSTQTIKNKQKGSLDTYVIFLELGYKMLKKDGVLAYIVPMPITSNDSVSGIHNIILNNCNPIYVSSYAVRPKPVFKNAVVNSSIVIFTKTMTKCEKLYTSQMYRRGDDFNLQHLVDNLSFVNSIEFVRNGRFAKISHDIEKNILSKIFKQTPIKELLSSNGLPVFYRTVGGRYFKVITNYTTYSNKESSFNVDSKYRDIIACALSSNLSFWFYQVYSNNLSWSTYDIFDFTIPISLMTDEIKNRIENIYNEYLVDIEANANTRNVSAESKYTMDIFKEYKIVRSKHIVDKIDDILCPLYGMSKDEIEFIKNYELEFRMGGE